MLQLPGLVQRSLLLKTRLNIVNNIFLSVSFSTVYFQCPIVSLNTDNIHSVNVQIQILHNMKTHTPTNTSHLPILLIANNTRVIF